MNEPTDATSILAPLWRRKWLILAVGIVVAAASYLYYKHQRPVYQAATQLYLGAGSEEQATGEKNNGKTQANQVNYQAALINSIVVEKVHKELRAKHKKALVKGAKIKAKAVEKSQFINITAQTHTARGAAQLANLTAQTYISRQRATHQRVTERQLEITRRQLRRIEVASAAKGTTKTTAKLKGKEKEAKEKTEPATTLSTTNVLQEANLNSKINQLEASLAQTGAEQTKVAAPSNSIQLSPKPRKNAIFGFVIGIVLAAIAAYLLSRADRRLRTIVGVEHATEAQVIAGLPKVKRPIVRRGDYPVPSRFLVEPLRRLNTALQLMEGSAQREQNHSATVQPPRRRGRVILVTSADSGDGKSTLVADLALVQRDANSRVAVVEANFRRPVQARLFGLDGTHGLAEVLAGGLDVGEAMQRVMPPAEAAGSAPVFSGAGVATAVESQTAGALFVLAGSGQVANPPAMLANGAMGDLLGSLADDFDYVLVDAPSPLEVSDALPLLASVDGVLLVARIGHTRELAAHRLVQLLAQSSTAPVLGVVANCVSSAEAARYGFAGVRGGVGPRLIGR